jgi:hypothetical protein
VICEHDFFYLEASYGTQVVRQMTIFLPRRVSLSGNVIKLRIPFGNEREEHRFIKMIMISYDLNKSSPSASSAFAFINLKTLPYREVIFALIFLSGVLRNAVIS